MNRFTKARRGMLWTQILAGGTVTVLLSSQVAMADTVRVQSGGTLRGAGSIDGAVVVESGGRISPGNPSAFGCLRVSSLTLESGSVVEARAAGTGVCTLQDGVQITGDLTMGNAQVSVLGGGYTPAVGDELVILSVDGSAPGTPFFQGTTPVETVTVSGVAMSVETNGGDGNDVSLSYRSRPSNPVIVGSEISDDGEITLQFDVANEGASALTSVAVQCTGGGQTISGTVSGGVATVTGLNPDVAYTCTVTATNADGSAESRETAELLPALAPNGLPIWLLYEAGRAE